MEMVAMNPLFPHPEQSVVTSCIERNPILIPKFEYAEPIHTLEVVLPTGDLLRTGSAASPGAPFDTVADMVCPYGPGLDFYRLFQGAQGTLGVVTWMNIKIEYFSPLRKIYYVQSESLPDLLSFVHRVQRLMIGNECFILKRPDMAAIGSGGDPDRMSQLLRELKRWTALIQIAGARWRPEERIKYQERAFLEICRELSMMAQDSLTPSRFESDTLENRLQMPWKEGTPYWKYLKQGGCHDIAFHTTFDRLPRILSEADSLLEEKGFNDDRYGVYIQPLEYGRAYYCKLHFFYDPCSEDRVKQVADLDHILNRRLLLSGVLFNTPHGAQAALTYDHAAMVTETLKKVKKIFDPMGIMNPGHLCF
jgi:FAD/FMN-containing dehydrogenase